MKSWNYVRADSRRFLKSYRYLIGIGGVFATLFCARLDVQDGAKSVIWMVGVPMNGIPFLMCLLFGIISFSDSVCEDVKSRYYRLEIIRGQLRTYCNARTFTVFFAAFLSVLLGFLLYVFYLRIQFPWKLGDDDHYFLGCIQLGAFRAVLKAKHFVLYYILEGMQLGMLAGILALFSAYISLNIKNRLLVYTVPVISFYYLSRVEFDLPIQLAWLNIYRVFIPAYNVWNNDLLSFFWAVSVSFMGAVLFRMLMYHKIKRALKNE